MAAKRKARGYRVPTNYTLVSAYLTHEQRQALSALSKSTLIPQSALLRTAVDLLLATHGKRTAK